MNISGILTDLAAASARLNNISDDVANMVIIDGNTDSAATMNAKIAKLKEEIDSIYDVIEANKAIIQNCADTLGIYISFSSVSSARSTSSYAGSSGGTKYSAFTTYTQIR